MKAAIIDLLPPVLFIAILIASFHLGHSHRRPAGDTHPTEEDRTALERLANNYESKAIIADHLGHTVERDLYRKKAAAIRDGIADLEQTSP